MPDNPAASNQPIPQEVLAEAADYWNLKKEMQATGHDIRFQKLQTLLRKMDRLAVVATYWQIPCSQLTRLLDLTNAMAYLSSEPPHSWEVAADDAVERIVAEANRRIGPETIHDLIRKKEAIASPKPDGRIETSTSQILSAWWGLGATAKPRDVTATVRGLLDKPLPAYVNTEDLESDPAPGQTSKQLAIFIQGNPVMVLLLNLHECIHDAWNDRANRQTPVHGHKSESQFLYLLNSPSPQAELTSIRRLTGGSGAPEGTPEPTVPEHHEEILQALFLLKAFDRKSRKKAPDIAKKIDPNLDPAKLKGSMAALAAKGDIKTKTGRGGGAWLTESGKERAEEIEQQ